jgi:hypothetical protein
MTDLIPLENVNAVELFADEETIKSLLGEIEKQARDFTPDVTTPQGRKDIASQAYKVTQSKGVIDKAGKELTAEWAAKKRLVDSGRKMARDFCDNLRDEIRQPLTAYEAEQAELAKQAAIKAEIEADEIDAYEWNDLYDREAAVKAHEEKIQAEKDAQKRAEAKRAAAERRKKNEERIREEAAKKAAREAEDAIRRAREATEKAEKAARDEILRVEKAARDEAERVERERLQRIEDNEREAQARAADKANRRKINGAIIDALIKGGVSKTAAVKVVKLVAGGNVPAIHIRY